MSIIYEKKFIGITRQAKFNKQGWLSGYRIIINNDDPLEWHRLSRIPRKMQRMGFPYSVKEAKEIKWREISEKS